MEDEKKTYAFMSPCQQCVHMTGLKKYDYPHSKSDFCFCTFFSMAISTNQAAWVITGHMKISSQCSMMSGLMTGMSFRPLTTLRQEEISLTPISRVSVCLPWKNICFIVISTDLSHSATLHNMIKSSSVNHRVYHYKNTPSLTSLEN